MSSDLNLMKLHVNVLFQHNVENRITYVNEPPHDEAPRFFFGGTKDGRVIRYHSKLSERVMKEINKVMDSDTNRSIAEIIRILNKDQEIESVEMGPAYIFPDVKSRKTSAIKLTSSNKGILLPHYSYTYEEFELRQPCYAIVQNDMVVSLCCSARQTDAAAEASLFTMEEYRGRAYGGEVANAWAAEVQRQGKVALYSTSWDNFSSQSVAEKLNLRRYGTDIHIS
ncbi:MAG: GNAT family N-acetyltransferase [Heyndrickxia sp.]